MSSEFSAIAGHRVLDLVNTVDWRLSPEKFHERLGDDGAAVRWAAEFGFCRRDDERRLRSQAGEGALVDALREVREWVHGAALHHDEEDAAALQRHHLRWQQRATLRRAEDGSSWELGVEQGGPDTLCQAVARAAVEFLVSPMGDAVSQCADDECGWVFVDTSPRHNRRWCVAADCGARNRSRRHYARARQAPAAGRPSA